jgi:hypothetical protein
VLSCIFCALFFCVFSWCSSLSLTFDPRYHCLLKYCFYEKMCLCR